MHPITFVYDLTARYETATGPGGDDTISVVATGVQDAAYKAHEWERMLLGRLGPGWRVVKIEEVRRLEDPE